LREDSFHSLSLLLVRLSEVDGLIPALEEVLDAAIELVHADGGYIRLLNVPATFNIDGMPADISGSPFAAQRGHSDEFIEYFSSFRSPINPRARRGMTRGVPRIIEDMTTHPDFEEHRAQTLASGFRSMQGIPMVTKAGRAVGGICTSFNRPYTPPEEELHILNLYAGAAAAVIERHQQIAELKQMTMMLSSTAGILLESIRWMKNWIDEIEARSPLDARELRRIAKLAMEELQRATELTGASNSLSASRRPEELPEHPYGLSIRELEVLVCIWRGMSDKEIARLLNISRFTVSRHVTSVLRKMNAVSRTQVALRAEREGLVNNSLTNQTSETTLLTLRTGGTSVSLS